MSFCLPRFLRRIQPSDLQGYFSARAIHFSEPIDWTAKATDLLSSAKTAIEALPERERERVFEDFERIDQVSDEIGQRALRSLIEQDESSLRRFHSCNGSEARGLFVLLTEEEAFDNAKLASPRWPQPVVENNSRRGSPTELRSSKPKAQAAAA